MIELWNRIRGWFVTVAGVILLLVITFFQGKKKGKTEAKIKELSKENEQLKEITVKITDDAKIVVDVKEEVNALPTDDLRARARKWVRD